MNLPLDFMEQIRSLLGADEAARLFDSLQGTPAVSVRMNRDKTSSPVPFRAEPVPWCPEGFYLDERPVFTLDPLLHAGGYYVQEASSMFLHRVLAQYAGAGPVRMLDLCAAPGGKSTLACAALPSGSLLVANEVMRNRVSVLAENLTKWGNPGVVVTHNDPADFTPLGSVFDVVLVDAPCSGEGMFRKDPVAVGEWSPANVELCVRRQQRILADIWPCLKPGGLFIYSTCTYNIKENEEQVRRLRDEWGAEPQAVCGVPDEWNIAGNLLPGEDFPVYRFLPHRTRGEGFFLAALRKPAAEGDEEETMHREARRGKPRREKDRKPRPQALPRELSAQALGWLAGGGDAFEVVPVGTTLTAVPRRDCDFCARLRTSLRVWQAGVALGEAKGRDLVPAHALAMSTALRPDAFPRVEVSQPEALAYLRREAVVLPGGTPRGFVLLTWQGLPLGFAKNVGNRANNLYPPEWRIRMQA